MNTKALVSIIAVVAIVAVGGYLLYQNSATPNANLGSQDNNSPATDTTPIPTTHEIMYGDTGYSPSPLTVKVGDTVVWKNQSSTNVWTGSAMHPAHTVYSGTTLQQHCPDADNAAFDQCKAEGPGTTWSFTFNKVGEWGYHNHVKANHFGKIIVQE